DRWCELAKAAGAQGRNFSVALSGGSTPKALYELLSTPEYSGRVDWKKTLLFLGDERCVAHDHPDSNYGMVKSALLSKVSIPSENVFATEGQEKDPDQAARNYDAR